MKHRNGFLFFELCLAVSILLLLVSLSAISAGRPQENQQLDILTKELAWDLAAVRQHAVGNNESGSVWKLSVRQNEYIVLKGTEIVKRRPFGKAIKLNGTAYRKDFYFDVQGKPEGNQMEIVLQEKTGQERKIIIAAQTGRIRLV